MQLLQGKLIPYRFRAKQQSLLSAGPALQERTRPLGILAKAHNPLELIRGKVGVLIVTEHEAVIVGVMLLNVILSYREDVEPLDEFIARFNVDVVVSHPLHELLFVILTWVHEAVGQARKGGKKEKSLAEHGELDPDCPSQLKGYLEIEEYKAVDDL